jgi:hypothetical protein
MFKCFSNSADKYKVKNNKPKKALLIGINYIGTSSALSGCMNDIIDIYTILKQNGYSEFLILGEKEGIFKEEHRYFIPLIKDIPTKNNIINGFKWLIKDSDKYDNTFIHYSGHGSFTYSNSEDEIDHREEMLVPLDYQKSGCISDDIVNNILVKGIKCKLFALIDACHSGSSLDLKYSFGSKMYLKGILNRKKNWTEDYYVITEPKQPELNKEVHMISGCSDTQTSADAFFDKPNGALTFVFLKVLKENKYNLTFKKMLRDINYYMKQMNFSQSPMISSCKKDGINDTFTF